MWSAEVQRDQGPSIPLKWGARFPAPRVRFCRVLTALRVSLCVQSTSPIDFCGR